MEKVSVSLRHCYGIASLDYIFDFSQRHQNVLYAANGIMKTSLALTFSDLAEGRPSQDRIHKDRPTTREIVDESGTPLAAESVFVVEPYNETYRSGKVSTLLVNAKLRERYDEVRREIDLKRSALVSALNAASGMKVGADEALASDVSQDSSEFFRSIRRLAPEVAEATLGGLADLRYAQIFNPKVSDLLKSDAFRADIQSYMDVYDRLVTGSTFFRKGAFNHNNASDVAKSLKSNGFFKADHSVYVNNKDVRQEIKTEKDLEDVIQAEKDEILNNAELKAQFERIDKLLTKNVDVREFRAYLDGNDKLIPELINPDRLRQRLWIAYLAMTPELLNDALATYDKGREELEAIIDEARKESTRWAEVLAEFNSRFSVPFIVTMENQHDVILREQAPSVRFRFKGHDGTEVAVEEADLVRVLSNGEKRALYLLNVIFEVIARKEAKIATLFLFDDIADSFDYKNKYAIVEYLRDITEVPFFYQLILTHNYDFYRTVSSRLDLRRANKLHTLRTAQSIQIREEKYQNNPFKHWKEKLPEGGHDDFLLAMIPFVRNIAEFAGDEAVEASLTRFLHVQAGSEEATVAELESDFKKVIQFKKTFSLPQGDRKVFELLFDRAAHACALKDEEIELETKIVLAMAIRIRAELFMIARINEPQFVSGIKGNQTFQLLHRLDQLGTEDEKTLKCLKQVVLMTPENIHLNSFMYEPILDMSNHHLRSLYEKVTQLK